jgi:hypothetical protein
MGGSASQACNPEDVHLLVSCESLPTTLKPATPS